MTSQDNTAKEPTQDELRVFVDRNLYYCVSPLIHHLAQNEGDEYHDEILTVCTQDDWQGAAEDMGWEQFTDKFGANCYRDISDSQTWAGGGWQELCEEFDIDPHLSEAYEHWIVSDHLATKLEAEGEMVSRDIHGLTVWGRTCTGQAILLDYVISQIYRKLHA